MMRIKSSARRAGMRAAHASPPKVRKHRKRSRPRIEVIIIAKYAAAAGESEICRAVVKRTSNFIHISKQRAELQK